MRITARFCCSTVPPSAPNSTRYASFVYDSATDSCKRTLDTVHHSSLRVATGAFRTSPTSSLLVEANEPSLQSRRLLLGLRYALKLRQFSEHPSYYYAFSPELLSLFSDSAHRALPFCLRVKDLCGIASLSFYGVRRANVMAFPPWTSVDPQIDISLSDVRKADLHPRRVEISSHRALVSIPWLDSHLY